MISYRLFDKVFCGRNFSRVLLKQWIMYTFGKIGMRQGILFGHFSCDRVPGVQVFATHSRHFPSQVPQPPGKHYTLIYCNMFFLRSSIHIFVVAIFMKSENGKMPRKRCQQ